MQHARSPPVYLGLSRPTRASSERSIAIRATDLPILDGIMSQQNGYHSGVHA